MKKVITALVVPFDESGGVNERGLRQIVRHNIDQMQVDGLYVGGSTGENFLLDEETKKRIFSIVIDEAKNDVMLIAQIGSLNVEEAIRLGKECKRLGYETLSSITPFYYKFTFDEIKTYYERLISELQHPLIIYSIPSFTGTNFSIAEYGELLKDDHVIGVKYSDVDVAKLSMLKKSFPDKVFYSGSDDMLFQFGVSGADGAIGSTYSLLGIEAKEVYQAIEQGDVDKAHATQRKMNDVILELVRLGVYPTIKYLLSKKGIEAGRMQFPLSNLTEAQQKEADRMVEN